MLAFWRIRLVNKEMSNPQILVDFTTNKTLENEAERLGIPLWFCWHKTSFTKPRKNGGYIINLSDDGQMGTHWVSLWKQRDQYAYFDPFGFPPPEEVERLIPKYYYNESVIQDPADGGCGAYGIEFLQWMNESSGSVRKKFQEFLNTWKPNFKKNRKLLARRAQD